MIDTLALRMRFHRKPHRSSTFLLGTFSLLYDAQLRRACSSVVAQSASAGQDQSTETQDDLSARNSDNHD